jgi:hypothetical protein
VEYLAGMAPNAEVFVHHWVDDWTLAIRRSHSLRLRDGPFNDTDLLQTFDEAIRRLLQLRRSASHMFRQSLQVLDTTDLCYGTVFPDFLRELETMVRAVGRVDLVAQLQELPVLSRCTCGDSNRAHFYTWSKRTSLGGQHEDILLPSRSGLVVLDVLHGRVMAVEILDRPDVKRVLDAHLPAHRR